MCIVLRSKFYMIYVRTSRGDRIPLKIRTTSKMKITQKMKTTKTMKITSKNEATFKKGDVIIRGQYPAHAYKNLVVLV